MENTTTKRVTVHSPYFDTYKELDQWIGDFADLIGIETYFINVERYKVNAKGKKGCTINQNTVNYPRLKCVGFKRQ